MRNPQSEYERRGRDRADADHAAGDDAPIPTAPAPLLVEPRLELFPLGAFSLDRLLAASHLAFEPFAEALFRFLPFALLGGEVALEAFAPTCLRFEITQ